MHCQQQQRWACGHFVARWLVVAVCLMVMGAAPALALTWDANTGTTDVQDGSGTWNNTNTNWWDGSTNVPWSPGSADFGAGGGGSYTVTVGEPITFGPAIFNAGSTYTITGGSLNHTSGTITANGDATIESPISGTVFHKLGGGTLTLTCANSFSGTALDVKGGVLNIRNSSALGSISYCHVYATSAALEVQDNITVSRGVYIKGAGAGGLGSLRSVSGDNAWNGYVRLHWDNPNASIGVDAGSTLTVNGRVEPVGGSNGALRKVGDGELILTNANTYQWPTAVDDGVLTIRNDTALGTTVAGTTVASGAALQMANDITVSGEQLTINGAGISDAGALRSIGGDNVWDGPVTQYGARIGVDAGTLTISGQLSGSGTFRKTGAGTLVLSAANNYSATTDVVDGTLSIQDGMALGVGYYCHVYDEATLELSSGISVPRGLYIGNNSTADTVANLSNVAGNNTWTGVVHIHAGHPYAIVGVDDGTTLEISGTIDTYNGLSGDLTKVGDGTLVLSGDNTVRTPFIVEDGVLDVRSATGLGTTERGTTVASGGTLSIRGDLAFDEPLSLAGYGNSGSNGALRSISGDNQWNGPVTITSGTYARVDADTLTISGAISGSGLFKYGAGLLILDGTNSYGGGGAMDVRQGPMSIRSDKALGNSSYCHVASSATLEVQDDITVTNGLYIGNSTTTNTIPNLHSVSGDNAWNGYVRLHVSHPYAVVQVDDGSTLTVNGRIEPHSGSVGRLTKTGGGTMAVTNANTYTGDTYLEAGTLLVNNTSGSGTGTGNVIVNGGTLGGTGTISGAVTVAGGTVAPGLSPGLLTTGSVAFDDTSTFSVEILGTLFDEVQSQFDYDRLRVNGDVALGDSVLEVALGYHPATFDEFLIIENDDADPVVGIFGGMPQNQLIPASFEGKDYMLRINYFGGTGNDVVLTAVPEPATMALLGLGIVGLCSRRRRK